MPDKSTIKKWCFMRIYRCFINKKQDFFAKKWYNTIRYFFVILEKKLHKSEVGK